MSILLTGGTGKTSPKIAPHLLSSSTPFLLTSRSPKSNSSQPYVQFDFADSTTYPNPFKHPIATKDPINAIFLITPLEASNAAEITNNFVNYAVKERGVKRFVLLTGTTATKGGPVVGEIWENLDALGVEYTVLKATWFNENFTEWMHFKSLKEEGKLYSAQGDGKVPFIAAQDIARIAYHALTSPQPLPQSLNIVGPELLNFDEVASLFTRILGRKVTHVRQSPKDRVQYYKDKVGMDEAYAGFMTWLEERTGTGGEEQQNNNIEKYTGEKPQRLEEWILEHKRAWD